MNSMTQSQMNTLSQIQRLSDSANSRVVRSEYFRGVAYDKLDEIENNINKVQEYRERVFQAYILTQYSKIQIKDFNTYAQIRVQRSKELREEYKETARLINILVTHSELKKFQREMSEDEEFDMWMSEKLAIAEEDDNMSITTEFSDIEDDEEERELALDEVFLREHNIHMNKLFNHDIDGYDDYVVVRRVINGKIDRMVMSNVNDTDDETDYESEEEDESEEEEDADPNIMRNSEFRPLSWGNVYWRIILEAVHDCKVNFSYAQATRICNILEEDELILQGAYKEGMFEHPIDMRDRAQYVEMHRFLTTSFHREYIIVIKDEEEE